ncbi:hypothetical protein FE773_06180 [Caminibacter mediatlanticus TB-2]|uniref:Uncharacterized protein n=1 Tax=Caminibacter mediatlanticus TB-2 TaxID=391592 RepID=A0AAI9AII3_9BACT|nr:hypothetical protein [Caminibacter mediatlanticus]EDM24134.1 hypothetical protein CMTB2_01423 [Caminibacter mediatlanticus TB-2]QCT94781.1 hypothetical protein FE773_06180 [Caminibacter mediatlanticus TB-2]
MKINRFPKMAALQKFRAMKLGFDNDIAEAIGIAEATKYAIFKNLSYKKRVEKEKEEVFKTYKGEKLLDDKTFEIFKLQSLDGLPYVGGKVYTSDDYKRAVFIRFGEEIGKKIEEWAKNIINKCDEKVLKSENKFFNECWKPHRDELKEV